MPRRPPASLPPRPPSPVPQPEAPAPPQTFALSNTGTTALTITSFGLSGTTAGSFTLANSTCATTLAAGATCTLSVTFSPAAAGSYTASLTVLDNASGGSQSSTLSGTGTAAGSLTLLPAIQSFASTAVGATSVTQSSILSNTTSQVIYLSSGSLTDAADFTQSDNCNGLIGAGGTCTVVFSFTPKATGAFTSTYSIHNLNTPASVLSVTLSGTETGAPVATLRPGSLTFLASVNVPAVNQTVTLTNSGNAPVTISAVTIGGANPGSFSIASQTCGATLARMLPAP